MRNVQIMMLMVAISASSAVMAEDLGSAISKVRESGPNGKGSREAAEAWPTLANASVEQLPQLLAAMDGANSVVKNWIRSAIESCLEKAAGSNTVLPLKAIETFIGEGNHDGQARRFAFELLQKNDATAKERLLPKMANDPDPELRYDAIAVLLKKAEAEQKAKNDKAAIALFEQSINSASDRRQIHQSAIHLREMNQKVDLPEKLGLILNWKVLGPFPNDDLKGMDFKYPPETKIDFAAKYTGKAFPPPDTSKPQPPANQDDPPKEAPKVVSKPAPIEWKDYVTDNEYGTINLKVACGGCEYATAFAVNDFQCSKDQEVEIRLGCYTAFKLFLNGELILDRRDEFAGSQMDHYVLRAKMKKGSNQLVMKSVQGIIPPPLSKAWQFTLRVCDLDGKACLATNRPKIETKPIDPKAPPRKS